MTPRKPVVLIITALAILSSLGAGGDAAIYGTWQFNKAESTDIAAWSRRTLHLSIRDSGDSVTIVHDWRNRGRGSWADSLTITPGGEPVTRVVESEIWPGNWFMGVLAKVGSETTTNATWTEPGRKLVTEVQQVVEVSQGEATILTFFEYALDRNGDRLTLTERRSTRPTPVKLVFDRAAAATGER